MKQCPLAFARFLRSVRPAYLASFLKKLLGIKRVVVTTTFGDFLVDPVSHLGYSLISSGEFEPHLEKTLSDHLSEGKVFVDLGSNEGYFSVLASNLVGTSGRVVAVEPQSRLQSIIQENIKLNNCKNVEVLAVAVSNSSGETIIHLTPDVNPGATSLFPTISYSLPTETVRVVTLSELFQENQIEYCDLLKVDIEGAEYEAITGADEIFRSKRVGAIAIEMHEYILKARGLDAEDITRFLVDLGYELTYPYGYQVFLA